jgi:hypothetical protein
VQVIYTLPSRWKIGGQVVAWGTLAVLLFIPQLNQDWHIVRQRRLPDRRVELRQWVDSSLDPGTVIVSADNHKTFNPLWGGIPYQNWVDWWETDSIMEYPVAEWRDQRGMAYAAIDRWEWEQMQATAEGQAYLEEMLHLRDFTTPPSGRGPEVIFYRLWKAQVETSVRFGESIALTGYDLDKTTVSAGESAIFRFYWNARTTPADNYSLFVHLTPPELFEPVAQADGAPGTLTRPTLTWNTSDETLISPAYTLTVPDNLTPGDYQVRIGLYNYQTGVRLPLEDAPEDSYPLVQIRVPG